MGKLGTSLVAGGVVAGGLIAGLMVADDALAALTDSYGPARVGSATISCVEDEATTSLCTIEVQRVRSLTTAAQAEATAAGIELAPIRERTVRRTVQRGVLQQFLANQTTVVP